MMDIQRKQNGNTLLGVIIGLVIGLGAALVVAVMISKAPMPFLSKSIQSDKLSSLLPGQLSDPNKPMYGNKEAAKEAARDFVKEAPATADTVAAPKQLAPATAEPAAAAPAAAATATAAAPAASAAAADEKYIYYLQAGAFREISDAEGMRAKLALQGVQAGISERQSDNGTLYRVRIGPFNQLEAMNKVRSKLLDGGIELAIVRTAR